MKFFTGKIVWVTGASSGIGAALVYKLVSYGAYVILSSRNVTELQRVNITSGAKEGQTLVLPMDLTKHASFPDIVNTAISWKGHIDILINNGGVSQRSLSLETTLDVEKRIFDVNYFGTVELTRLVAGHMVLRKSGHINVVSSVLGKIAVTGRATYCSTKHALHGYFDALRAELHEHGVGVSVVCPGYIKTNVSINAVTSDGSSHSKMDKPQQKGMPADIFAVKMLRRISRGRNEFYIGGIEVLSIYLMRWMPWLVFRVQRLIKFRG